MPLSFDQFKALRSQGLSVDQINRFEAGQTPATPAPASAPVAPPTTTQKVGSGIVTGLKEAGQAGIGAIKSIPAAVDQTSQLGQRMLGGITNTVAKLFGKAKIPTPVAKLPSAITTPSEDVNQRAGFLGGQIGQALALPTSPIIEGAGQVAKTLNLGNKVQPFVTGAAKAIANAGTNAVLSKVQGGTDSQAKNAALIGGGLSLAGSVLGPVLKTSAERSYSKALGATTKDNKILSDKVVPELINRNTVAMTRSGLFNKAASNAEVANDALETGYGKLPAGAKTDWKPVLDKLQKAKQDITVNGVVQDVGRYRALEGVQQRLLDTIGGGVQEVQNGGISVESARKVRQILDRAISNKTKTFGLTGKESDMLAVEKLAANSIRSQLAKDFPDIDKLNKEFSFWNNVKNVVGDTIQRTKSQTSLAGELATDTGAVVGASLGGGVGSAIGAGVIGKLLNSTIKSTAWRTTSAITKHQLANFLASGNIPKATAILQRISSQGNSK